MQETGQLPFEFLATVAHCENLALAERNGPGFVRVRYAQVGKQRGVLLEELGIRFQEVGDRLRRERRLRHGLDPCKESGLRAQTLLAHEPVDVDAAAEHCW